MGMETKTKRGPGRPPGSKNKAKAAIAIDSDNENLVIQDSPTQEFPVEGEYPETVDDLSPAIEPEPEVIEITITIPVVRPSEGSYTKRHIEVWLQREESKAHRWLYDGLVASGAVIQRRDSERDVRSSADVERWLMQAIADALPAEEEKSEDAS